MSPTVKVTPSARRLIRSLRDVGYNVESAIADLVDNSIAAEARKVQITITFDGKSSSIRIIDDGNGMSSQHIDESMRFGSRRSYDEGELGRYGLGLKTASLSQGRRLEVVSVARGSTEPEARTLDLDYIEDTDRWEVLDVRDEPETQEALNYLTAGHGTVVTWRKLDRLLPSKSPEGGWARRRIEGLSEKLETHLSMVFHRFLGGTEARKISIEINGKAIDPWDPFIRQEPATSLLDVDEFEIEHDGNTGAVTLHRYLLPSREQFTSREAFEKASGPEKWNRQQGLYIYRADRLVQWGGWSGIRTIDEHTKSARASLDFGTTLDEAFNINVAKMRVSIPGQLRKMLARPINELCIAADASYRRGKQQPPTDQKDSSTSVRPVRSEESRAEIGLTLRAAAARTGHTEAFRSIAELIRNEAPDIARQLGLD